MSRCAVRVMPRRTMMRAMPSLAMMMLRRVRRTGNQQHRNNRYQRQLENVFHVKSPDS
jgi:hypothetical protein